MSVSSELYVGYTIELEADVSTVGWKKIHAFEDQYPEIDKYNHHWEEREGKVLLVADGMCGTFARLIWVDKYKDEASLGDSNEYFKLAEPESEDKALKIAELTKYYRLYTGDESEPKIEYAMWNLWG